MQNKILIINSKENNIIRKLLQDEFRISKVTRNDIIRYKLWKELEKNGYTATLLALREITPNALMQFPRLDAFVNTGCPRLSLDDSSNFRKPLLSINETLVLLGEVKWENLFRRGWFENVI